MLIAKRLIAPTLLDVVLNDSVALLGGALAIGNDCMTTGVPGLYVVALKGSTWHWKVNGVPFAACESLEAGKAACQADLEKRLEDILEPVEETAGGPKTGQQADGNMRAEAGQYGRWPDSMVIW